jgi:predicted enzyme related to lactoylglutathione lyase
VGGLCHARGANAGVPPVWLSYVRVKDMANSLAEVQRAGGRVLQGPRGAGGGQMAVIQDPSGAVLALYQG